jgi:hypothetical protein
MVKNTWQSEATDSIINDIINTFTEDSHLNAKADILTFLNSVSIKHLKFKTKGNIEVLHFNIYANSKLISDNDVWFYLCNSLTTLPYTTPMQGKGSTNISPFTCGICHRVDYPTGMCKFPKKDTWHGPTCDTVIKPSLPFLGERYNCSLYNNRQPRF